MTRISETRRQTTIRRAIAQAEVALDVARRQAERIARRIDALDTPAPDRFKQRVFGIPTEADRHAAERFVQRLTSR